MFASQAAVSALPLVVANKSTTTKRDVTRRRLHPHAATRSGIACQSLGRSAPKLAKNPSMATPSRPHARFGASQSRGSSAFAPRASASAAATEGGKAQEPSGISYFTSNVRADVLAGLTGEARRSQSPESHHQRRAAISPRGDEQRPLTLLCFLPSRNIHPVSLRPCSRPGAGSRGPGLHLRRRCGLYSPSRAARPA